MRKPEFVTFTGVDDRTDLDALLAIDFAYRGKVEWGVLFSKTQQGSPGAPRFPGLRRLRELQEVAREVKLAAHLCGEFSRRVMAELDVVDFPAVLTGVYRRAQVNHTYAKPHAIAAFGRACRLPCVGQFTVGPFPQNDSIQWLYDPSGGFGRSPGAWPRHPGGDRLVGYAGGIGPDNAAEVVEQIDAQGPYWIDMETRIRTDDWLDLEKCGKVLEAVYGG